MSEAHHTRSHAQWSASATARNVVCPGAIAMETLVGEGGSESEAAAWGTAAHQVAQKTFAFPRIASLLIGETEKTKGFEFVVDEEMADTAQQHVDYCQSRLDAYREQYMEEIAGDRTLAPQFWIERNFSLAAIDPPFEAGGTGDFIVYFPMDRMLEIVDLKGGRGVIVEVKGNPQARSYALGAMLAFPDFEIDVVRSTIVQPRAHHPDGRIRSEEIHVAELMDWTIDLLGHMRRSRVAYDEFNNIGGASSGHFPDWAEKWLTPGQCTFCPAKALCPAFKNQALAVTNASAARWFEDEPVVLPSASSMTPEQLGKTLDGFGMLEEWIKAVRAYGHAEAKRGVKIPGWQLAESVGNRKWIETDQDKLAAALKKIGLADERIWEPESVHSPAQAEKKATAAQKQAIAALTVRPVTGSNLVSAEKSTRSAALSSPEKHFEKLP